MRLKRRGDELRHPGSSGKPAVLVRARAGAAEINWSRAVAVSLLVGKYSPSTKRAWSADDIQWLDDGEELSEMLDGGGSGGLS